MPPACEKFDIAGCDLEERDINKLNEHIKVISINLYYCLVEKYVQYMLF